MTDLFLKFKLPLKIQTLIAKIFKFSLWHLLCNKILGTHEDKRLHNLL